MTKRCFDGFNNSQKLRVILNGITIYTTIKGVMFDLFGNTDQRAAVCDALLRLSFLKRTANCAGVGAVYRGYQIQVDLM